MPIGLFRVTDPELLNPIQPANVIPKSSNDVAVTRLLSCSEGLDKGRPNTDSTATIAVQTTRTGRF
jgi:hypothetical protein